MYSRAQIELLRELVAAQYKVRDQSTILGFLWSFLHPLLLLGVMYVFFNRHLGSEIEHYGLYLLIGLVHYTHFSNITGAALRTLRSTRQLTSEAVFPKELLVFGNVAAGSIEFGISMAICLVIAAASGVEFSMSLLWLPVVLLLQLLLVTWVGLALASVYPFAADIDHLYQIFLRMLFLATPIFYDASLVGDGLAGSALRLNPLAQLIELSRNVVIYGRVEALPAWGLFLVANLALSGLAFAFFKRLEPQFAENV